MIHERIYLDKTDERVYIDTYVPNEKGSRPAILVIPGGGYANVCTDREGEPIALAFVEQGFNAFVLNYRVGKEGDVFPKQLIDASRAMLYIKENAEKYSTNPKRGVGTCFSAGGHLTGSLATMYDYDEIKAEFGEDYIKIKPTGAILCYPVVSVMESATHVGSFENLLGKKLSEFTEEERRRYSLEYAARENSAPMFIWHTATDELVPVIGSLSLAKRMAELKLPLKVSIYPYGTHGVALANERLIHVMQIISRNQGSGILRHVVFLLNV